MEKQVRPGAGGSAGRSAGPLERPEEEQCAAQRGVYSPRTGMVTLQNQPVDNFDSLLTASAEPRVAYVSIPAGVMECVPLPCLSLSVVCLQEQEEKTALKECGLGLLAAFQGCARLALSAAMTLSSSAETHKHGSRQLSAAMPHRGKVKRFVRGTAKCIL